MHRYLPLLLGLAFTSFLSSALADEPPRSLDPRIKITLFAEQPQLVTPTGIDVDHQGRVWVIESNTHFPPDGYKGHPSDRLLVMHDEDKDGRADKIVPFADGFRHAMSVAVRPVWLDMPKPNRDREGAVKEGSRQKAVGSEEKKAEPLTFDPKHFYVFLATRREVLLLEDTDGDLKCDNQTRLLHLETDGDYPHNGLAGFAFDALGWMYVGFGENLGATYKIIGRDGTTLSGGGEGGNIYRLRPDGTKLSLWATGFWNPHASCVDAFGRLFSVDNDPDSRPPCRLLHIIEGGDYGYRFSNGRKGLHPFTSWNGEIPGTLPMLAGTGEAPSGIIAYESDGLPEDFLGDLLVTSWGDHRIDRFQLQHASPTSHAEPLIQGGPDFRPVGIATAPDGSLFVSDWVKRDYNLHGHGRVWRVSAVDERESKTINAVEAVESAATQELLHLIRSPRLDVRRLAAREIARREEAEGRNIETPFKAGEERAFSERSYAKSVLKVRGTSSAHVVELAEAELDQLPREALQGSNDAFEWHTIRTIWGRNKPSIELLKAEFNAARPLSSIERPPAEQVEQMRLTCLLVARQHEPKNVELAKLGIAAQELSVRRLAVQWIAEERLTDLKPEVEKVLDGPDLSPDLFRATVAALDMLDGVDPKDIDQGMASQYAMRIVRDETRPASLRALALRMTPADAKGIDAELLGKLVSSEDADLRREAVRALQFAPVPNAAELLTAVARDETADVGLRADAIAALSSRLDGDALNVLIETTKGTKNTKEEENSHLSYEAVRALRGATGDAAPKAAEALDSLAASRASSPSLNPRLADQLALALTSAGQPVPENVEQLVSPRPKSVEQWLALVVPPSGGEATETEEDRLKAGLQADRGRRVFFTAYSAGCAKCHTVHSRGGRIGPDLSYVARTMDRKKLAESILDPSREIAPHFVVWGFELEDGRSLTGTVLGEGASLRIATPEGEFLDIPEHTITRRGQLPQSLMPQKLIDRLTVGEFLDLIAFLETLK